MLAVERLGSVFGGGGLDGFVPPQVAALGPCDVDSGAAHHDHVLHARLALDCLVDRVLQ